MVFFVSQDAFAKTSTFRTLDIASVVLKLTSTVADVLFLICWNGFAAMVSSFDRLKVNVRYCPHVCRVGLWDLIVVYRANSISSARFGTGMFFAAGVEIEDACFLFQNRALVEVVFHCANIVAKVAGLVARILCALVDVVRHKRIVLARFRAAKGRTLA